MKEIKIEEKKRRSIAQPINMEEGEKFYAPCEHVYVGLGNRIFVYKTIFLHERTFYKEPRVLIFKRKGRLCIDMTTTVYPFFATDSKALESNKRLIECANVRYEEKDN